MKKIMIVEDEILIAEDIKASLKGLGFGITSIIASGEDAVVRAGRELPDAVLMDINLRGAMDGIEAAEKIYSAHHIPVIFLTAFSGQDLLDRAKTTGSFGYLLKPFNDHELKIAIELALSKIEMDDKQRQGEIADLKAKKHESLKTLSGGIAHNFNNILAIVLGNLDLARMTLSEDQPAIEYLEEAAGSVQRAARLSHQLLTYLGILPSKMKQINLTETVEELLSIFQDQTTSTVKIEFIHGEETIFINGDIAQLGQVFNNLIENAIEAIGDTKGTITVTVGNEFCDSLLLPQPIQEKQITAGDYAYIEVSDTGCGMDEATLERAFDPFFSTKFTGRGLGLPAAYGVIQTHRGMITLRSKHGKGTTIKTFFPAIREPVRVSIPKSQTSTEKLQGSNLILLTGDQEILLQLEQRILENIGFKVLAATTGTAAVTLYKQHRDDIRGVLLNTPVSLSEGVETFKALKALNEDVIVIALTSSLQESVVQAFGDDQPAGYIQRPFTVASLKETLFQLLM